ncbi:MAG: hypothetical protein P8Z31_05905, partial [Gammaproteobacteria bacterium]
MRFSESWLRELVNPDIDTDALSHQLSMAGLEVDSVEKAAPGFHGVVVGEVLTKEQHPDADKLSVTSVDVGAGAPLQIVCGASNVAAGMRVPVATVGAVLPGGFAIKKAKLRGVESLGMICSAAELGLAESSDGIMPLPADAPPGADFRDWLNLDDALIEVDLTPDRGDCLSMIGVARDISALNSCDLTLPHFADVEPVVDDAMHRSRERRVDQPLGLGNIEIALAIADADAIPFDLDLEPMVGVVARMIRFERERVIAAKFNRHIGELPGE